ncbi:ABC transporter permease [Devosia sp. YIM 151766]|uniref:ABC transporter permease n=1 Tax=Devosia sp. YIM 151766 TaxID=3017325 RepID=UPI00255D0642|nr:ABC transporter permease [Devosia sp. YIM 151766]WIY53309.1 ABC transporter permease [Devosia sp. YIM 151766]
MSALRPLPRWADIALLPLLNLALAFLVSGLVVLGIGHNPFMAIGAIITGAFGSGYNIGYTLYYATNFVFAGLAVAVAAHGGLFNIGGNGQAYVAGLGVIVVALALQDTHWLLVAPAAVLAAALFGGFWGFIPGWLQAKRGSHVVITTIMFNFIASALMIYMLNRVLKPAGVSGPESAMIAETGRMPKLGQFFAPFNYTPVNLTIILAILALVGVYVLVWHTRFGYALRVMGQNPTAARYAGISNSRMIMLAMTLSGALAGMVAVNEVLGVQNRLVLDFMGDVGFVGIAVALMGRNHPVGIAFAALLFGALYQGGNELQYVISGLDRTVVVIIQALVILFTGAMEGLFRPGLQRTLMLFSPEQKAEAVARATVGPEG